MAKSSKYIKLDTNILLEYIYNDSNLISESYKILIDNRNDNRSYIASDNSLTNNITKNQLFEVDFISNSYGVVDPTYYSYLQYKDYNSGIPIKHDSIKIHIPASWSFGQYLGFYVRIYSLDLSGKEYNISNFHFNMSDVDQSYILNYTTPPLLFQEKMWGLNINIDIPSVSDISSQLESPTQLGLSSTPKENTLNYYLTNGNGLSTTSPIFIDFHYIEGIRRINGIASYILSSKITSSVPQSPDFQKLGLKISHSKNGDFFEVNGLYNGTIAEFKKFIDDSYYNGVKYYVQYDIVLYEQNIRGKTITITSYDSFNEPIEYRPIIKYSSTTAIIDVEMKLIDQISSATVTRKASYGLLPDQVSKYSLNLTKINLDSATKPKIYNIKNNIDASLIGKTNSMGKSSLPSGRIYNGISGFGFKKGIAFSKGIPSDWFDFFNKNGNGNGMGNGNGNGIGNGNGNGSNIQTVKVPYPVFIDKSRIVAKSDNSVMDNDIFYGYGKLAIVLYPFDNVVYFSIANGSNMDPDYLDLTGFNEIKLVFKNDKDYFDFPLMTSSDQIDLKTGRVIFNIPESKFLSLKSIYDSGVNLFYIIGTNGTNNNLIYTGLFLIYNSMGNISSLNDVALNPSVNMDPSLPKETAIVTQKEIKN